MSGDSRAVESIAVEAYGVTIEVTADAGHLSEVRQILPPAATPAPVPPEDGRFSITWSADDGLLTVISDGQAIAVSVDSAVAFGVLDAQIRMHIALRAPEFIFVHAGVVGHHDRAIVLPGKSFAGKTTLVAALVQAGAEYWSDEYAVLDAAGFVHPYAKPLSVRIDQAGATKEQPVESLGGRAGNGALSVGLIALTYYRIGASWTPRLCSPGEGALKLLEHAIPARSRPTQALEAVRCAAAGALVLEGERGEAQEAAFGLLAALAESSGI